MADVACPRCGVPLHDQPDYCWSCGFYVGDRWRTTQLTEGVSSEPRVVGPDGAAPEARLVGAEAPPPALAPGNERWIVRIVVVAVLVIVGLLAIALFGGRDAGAVVPAAPSSAAGTSPVATGGVPTTTSSMAAAPIGPTTPATVTRVVDGDTIVAAVDGVEVRVRYIGMDTPELVKPDTPVEPFALAGCHREPRPRRGPAMSCSNGTCPRSTDSAGCCATCGWSGTVAQVMVGYELVRAGLALVTTYPPDVRYVDALLEAQAQARADGLGVWSD